MKFTGHSVTFYDWVYQGQDTYKFEEDGEMEYEIKGEDIWLAGWHYATIKKLTSEELLLDLVGEDFTELYRKKK